MVWKFLWFVKKYWLTLITIYQKSNFVGLFELWAVSLIFLRIFNISIRLPRWPANSYTKFHLSNNFLDFLFQIELDDSSLLTELGELQWRILALFFVIFVLVIQRAEYCHVVTAVKEIRPQQRSFDRPFSVSVSLINIKTPYLSW